MRKPGSSFARCNLTSPSPIRLGVKQATECLKVGLLLYNAGAAHGAAPFLEQPLERSLSLIGLNPIGQVSLAHHFGQGMVARGRGGIVFIGLAAGAIGSGGIVTYCASKAFTQVLAEGLWAELKPRGVGVLCMPLGHPVGSERDCARV